MSQNNQTSDRNSIRITKSELTPFIFISDDDLPELITIGKEDLPDIVQITKKDLPEIIRISLNDLVPDQDLSNTSTDCFHGTSLKAARNIQNEGFRVGPGNVFGSGVYFAVGAVSIADSYRKSRQPCIIRARVNWGRVAYFDERKVNRKLGGFSGDKLTSKALSMGYDSIIQCSHYSKDKPTIGIVLGKKGSYIQPPRIEVVELLY
jgi:hypothetical protein